MKYISIFILINLFIVTNLMTSISLHAQIICNKINNRIETLDSTNILNPNISSSTSGTQGTVSQEEGDRMSFWIHGMNGNDGSWEKASAATISQVPELMSTYKARKLLGGFPNYSNTQNSLISAAVSGLEPQLLIPYTELEPGYPKNDCIFIAHSQGGLVSRQLDRIWSDERPGDRKTGGIALFGAPNGGSPGVADLEAKGQQFVTTMLRDLTEGYAVELISNSSWVIRVLARFAGVAALQDASVNFLTTPITDAILSSATSGLAPELATGSPQLNMLNDPNYVSPIPMVAFYGEKDDEVQTFILEDGTEEDREVLLLYALLNWMVGSPNEAPFFGANFDWPLQLQVNNFQAKYLEKAQLESAILNLLHYNNPRCGLWSSSTREAYEQLTGIPATKVCKFWLKNHYEEVNRAIQRRVAFQKGYHWFSKANDQWKVLIGAKGVTRGITCECTHNYYDYQSGRSESWVNIHDASASPDCSIWEADSYDFPGQDREIITCQQVEGQIGVWTKPSDGLVLVESVIAVPHMSEIPSKMDKSSHFGMRNDENTRIMLNKLWNGDSDAFFIVQPRN